MRDSIIGREAHDFDVASNARPEQVVGLFDHVIETGIKHGTVTVLLGGEGFEVTTFRGEGTYSDGRHPDSVQFLDSIEGDLARRDFTMNAIAYDPLEKRFCDPFHGLEDIRGKVIRAVGNPFHRFTEDGLRPLRGIRFQAQLGFAIDLGTLLAMSNVEVLSTLAKVSIERVTDELFKVMRTHRPSTAFNSLAETTILDQVLPELVPMIGCGQNRYHEYDVWEHTMVTLDHCPATDPVLRFGALFHDVSKPETKGVHPVTGDATFYDHEIVGAQRTGPLLDRLRFSTENRDRVVHLVRHHFIRYEIGWSAPALRRWVRRVGLDNIPSLCALARADIAGKGNARVPLETATIDDLEARVAQMKVTEVLPTSTQVLAINGHDLMQHLGITPGPVVGRILSALLESVTDDPECNTKERLLEIASTLPV